MESIGAWWTWHWLEIADTLYSIIVDAAVRRFQCQRAYLRANAGLRWMNARQSILRGQKPDASHLGALQQIDATLRNVRVCTSPTEHEALQTTGLERMAMDEG
jgi:uncharacterized protein HemX